MKRIDKLILKSFVGPFFLTTAVATFILLIQYMLKYFDDFVGKDLGFSVFSELIFYFSLNMMSISLPLGVLVSSLMTFGNLGEHFELTAIKGSGISLLRALFPIFIFVVFLSFGAFHFNNYVVPAANLKAYSLLYDIKHTKPALDIKPGIFYNGIPDYSIKVKEKYSDNQTLKEILIYDHTQKLGNKSVIMADSSRMYTFENDRYLKLELYRGSAYSEDAKKASQVDYLYRTYFDHMEIVFDLSSFGLRDTDEALFRNNRQMKTVAELSFDLDSMAHDKIKIQINQRDIVKRALKNHFKAVVEALDQEKKLDLPAEELEKVDTVEQIQTAGVLPLAWLENFFLQDSTGGRGIPKQAQVSGDKKLSVRYGIEESEDLVEVKNTSLDSLDEDSTSRDYLQKIPIVHLRLDQLQVYFKEPFQKQAVLDKALAKARNLKSQLNSTKARVTTLSNSYNKFSVEKYKKYSMSFACLVMFLIGAPLGAIIKKGGLGVPVIVSIFFFLTYYVLTITAEKWAKAGVTDPRWSVWFAHFFLLPIGLFFLRQARIDARLFDTDFYLVVLDKVKTRFKNLRNSGE